MAIERLDRLLTIKQIAAETGISRSTIYRLKKKGYSPSRYPSGIGASVGRNPQSKFGLQDSRPQTKKEYEWASANT